MQTQQSGHLSDADRAEPTVAAYLAAAATVRRLEADLSDARAIADASAAALDVGAGEGRGRLGRVARELGIEEQTVQNQRQRGKHPRRAVPNAVRRRVLTDAEYDTALRRADTAAHHQVPGHVLDAIACGVLAAVGLLSPPPEPDTDTCTAQWPDPEGEWWQCRQAPHPGGRHDAGDRDWSDDAPDAIPARP